MRNFGRWLFYFWFGLAIGLALPGSAVATPQAEVVSEEASVASLAQRLQTMPVEQVALEISPMVRDDLAALAEAARDIARARTQEAVDLGRSNPANAAPGSGSAEGAPSQAEYSDMMVEMLARRAAAFERLELVLSEWEKKGGDPEAVAEYRAYRRAIMSATVEAASLTGLLALAKNWLVSPDGGLRILQGLALFVLSFVILLFVAALVRGTTRRRLSHSNKTSKLLQTFIALVVYWLVILLGLALILSALGLEVAPIFALLGGASFVLAFALQETLGNFAAGLMILIYRPFDQGERVETCGITGDIERLNLTSTILRTPDNQLVTIPNAKVWNDVIVNSSEFETRRIDLEFVIAAPEDALGALQSLPGVLRGHPDVLSDPHPELYIGSYDGRGATLQVRPWVQSHSYWPARRSITQLIMTHLAEEDIALWEPKEWDQSPI